MDRGCLNDQQAKDCGHPAGMMTAGGSHLPGLSLKASSWTLAKNSPLNLLDSYHK